MVLMTQSLERFLNTRTYPSQIMKPFIGNNTNIFVHLRDGKKQVRRSVPKLVLLAFVGPPPPPSRQVRHIDGDQNNNALSNLKWDIRKAYFLPENADARKLFNEKAIHYVRAIAYRFFSHKLFGIPSFDLEDLMQISLLHIWNDIDTYNPGKVISKCPLCGEELIVYALYQNSYARKIGKHGRS